MKSKIMVILLPALLAANLAAKEHEEVAFELEEIVITATRTPQKQKDVPATINVVKSNEIETKAPFDLGEAIKDISGMQLERYGSYGSLGYLYLRGANSSQVLFMKDGRPLTNRATGTTDISQLITDNVERIEIKKGAASSLYGANALGGVVNIITKQNTKKPETTISTTVGTMPNNELNRQSFFHGYHFSHRNSFENADINLSGSFERSEGHRINNDYNAYNFDGNIGYKLSKETEMRFFGGYYLANKGVPNAITTPTTISREKDEVAYTKMQFSSSLSNDDNITGSAYWNKDVFDYNSPDALFGAQFTNRNIWTIGSEWQYDKQIAEHLITLGFSGVVDSMSGLTEQNNFGNPQVNSASVFGQDQIHLRSDIVGTIGARYDYNSKYGNQLNPSLGILFSLSEHAVLRTTFGTAFRAPTLNELFWPESAFEKGNPNLKPEIGWSFDTGIEYQYGMLASKFTFFLTEVKDLIEWAPISNNSFQWTPSNTDKANWKGIELELNAKLFPELNSYMNYTYLFTRNETFDTSLRYRPLNKANVGVEYTTPWQQIVAVNVQYQDIRYTDIANTKTLDSIWLTNLRVTQKISETMDASVICENINDLNYEFQPNYPMPRRSLKGGLNIKF